MSRIAMRTGAVEASKARQWPQAQVIVLRVGERHQNRETNEGKVYNIVLFFFFSASDLKHVKVHVRRSTNSALRTVCIRSIVWREARRVSFMLLSATFSR